MSQRPVHLFLMMAIVLAGIAVAGAPSVPESRRSVAATARASIELSPRLSRKGLRLGSPVLFRIFKEDEILEAWIRNEDSGRFILFSTYPICSFSGTLGPKQRQGDLQSPEGFYSVAAAQLNPSSQFHLAFNLGYPNAYDRAHRRTGSALMVHGNCVSIGCYAMTDPGIEEIYTLADAALRGGQRSFQVQAFPFRMTEGNLARHRDSEWVDFWMNLKEGYDLFERERVPVGVAVREGRYRFR